MLRRLKWLGWSALARLVPARRSTITLRPPRPARPEYRHRLVGVALLSALPDPETSTTALHLLYVASETSVLDPTTGAHYVLARGGPGVWNLRVPRMLPASLIVSAAGEATNGEFRHHILADGTHARELIVQDLRVRSLT